MIIKLKKEGTACYHFATFVKILIIKVFNPWLLLSEVKGSSECIPWKQEYCLQNQWFQSSRSNNNDSSTGFSCVTSLIVFLNRDILNLYIIYSSSIMVFHWMHVYPLAFCNQLHVGLDIAYIWWFIIHFLE